MIYCVHVHSNFRFFGEKQKRHQDLSKLEFAIKWLLSGIYVTKVGSNKVCPRLVERPGIKTIATHFIISATKCSMSVVYVVYITKIIYVNL